MTNDDIQTMARIGAVIRRVIDADFEMSPPDGRPYTTGCVCVLIHNHGDPLRSYVDYDCCQYDHIDALANALQKIGFYVEDCTGQYSAVYIHPVTGGSDGTQRAV